MNTVTKLITVAAMLATLSTSVTPAVAAAPAPARKAVVESEEIPLLMPPIVIIGKRMTPEEKTMFAQQERSRNMKKVARKKIGMTDLSALSAL